MYNRLTVDQRLIDLITSQQTTEIRRHIRLCRPPYLLDVPKVPRQGLYESYMRFSILEGAFAAAKTLLPYCDNPSAPNSVGETVGELLLKRARENNERILADEHFIALCRESLRMGSGQPWCEPLNTLLDSVPDYRIEEADHDDGYDPDCESGEDSDREEDTAVDTLSKQLAQSCTMGV